MKRIKGWLVSFEDFYIEERLHLWFGFVTIIAAIVVAWMMNTQQEHLHEARNTIIYQKQQLLAKDSEIATLKQRLELPSVSTPILTPIKIEENLNNKTDEVNSKIKKVQSAIVHNVVASQPSRTITKTEVKEVEKRTVVDKELKNLMLESYCASNPSDNICGSK